MAAALMNMNNGLMIPDVYFQGNHDLGTDGKRNKKDLSLSQIEKMKSMSPKAKKRYLKEIGKA